MRKSFTITVSILMAFATAALSGCGGGHAQTSDETAAVCTPSPAGVGQTVACMLEGTSVASLQDCTFFVEKPGARIPVSAEISESLESEEDGVLVSFRIPVLAERNVNLLVGCGEEFREVAQLTVGETTSEVDQDTIVPADRAKPVAVPSHEEDEEIVPGAPSVPASPSIPAVPAENAIGSTPVPTPPSFEVTLEGSLVPNPASPGAAHLSGVLRGGGVLREAYLYGPFAPDGNCERLLAIDPAGGHLSPGSRNHEDYRGFMGTRCDAALGNCEGFVAVAPDGTPAPVNCRVDLNRDLLKRDGGVFDFYFRISQSSTQTVLVVQSEDGILKTDRATIGGASLAAGLETVKITLSDNAPEFSVSFSYAQAHGNPSVEGCTSATPAPATSGISGTYKRERCALPESGSVDVTAVVPGLLGGVKRETYRVACGAPQSVLKKMSFTKTNGWVCTFSDDWARSCNEAGELELEGEAWKTCEIQKQRDDGTFETVSSHTVPWVEVKLTEVSAAGGSCATANNVWVPATPASVRNGRTILNRRLKRNHDCYNYAFSVKGSGTTLTETAPFEASFEILQDTHYEYCRGETKIETRQRLTFQGYETYDDYTVPSALQSDVTAGHVIPQYYSTHYNQCTSLNHGNEYRFIMWVDEEAYRNDEFFKISWKGRHLKAVHYTCSATGPTIGDSSVPGRVRRFEEDKTTVLYFPKFITPPAEATWGDAVSYGTQQGELKIKDDVMWATVTCQITATTYDNRTITGNHSWDACRDEMPTCLPPR